MVPLTGSFCPSFLWQTSCWALEAWRGIGTKQCLQEADGPGDKEPRRYLIGKGEMEGSALP